MTFSISRATGLVAALALALMALACGQTTSEGASTEAGAPARNAKAPYRLVYIGASW